MADSDRVMVSRRTLYRYTDEPVPERQRAENNALASIELRRRAP
jgi:hypothetical protein